MHNLCILFARLSLLSIVCVEKCKTGCCAFIMRQLPDIGVVTREVDSDGKRVIFTAGV
jgi:hypothetical protein